MEDTLINTIATGCKTNISHISSHINRGAGAANNHKNIEAFQNDLRQYLNLNATEYNWKTEKKIAGQKYKDRIDIRGIPKVKKDANGKSVRKVVIEIDAARADQIALKYVSRSALIGCGEAIDYVAIIYPKGKGKSMAKKTVELCYLNNDGRSSVVGLYVDPGVNQVEVWDFSKTSRFMIGNETAENMADAARIALSQYCVLHPRAVYSTLKKRFGRYVNNQRGASRYKNIGIERAGTPIFSYTQFRLRGTSQVNWNDFVSICRKNKIIIEDLYPTV